MRQNDEVRSNVLRRELVARVLLSIVLAQSTTFHFSVIIQREDMSNVACFTMFVLWQSETQRILSRLSASNLSRDTILNHFFDSSSTNLTVVIRFSSRESTIYLHDE